MYSDNQDIREMQEEILELLKRFHLICRKNKIRYTLHGGTMLGAVRENGFIPWDDDADIALMRSEYDKLCSCISKDKNSELYFDNFSDKMYKVWMKREGHPKVWIDVFVYDYISERKLQRKLRILGITLLTPFAKNEVSMEQFRINARARGIKKYIYEFIYQIGKIFDIEFRIRVMDKFERTALGGNKKFIHRSNDQLFAMKMIIKSQYMNKYVLLPFEDTKLMVSANYNEILISSYGDNYMIPRREQSNEKIHEIARNGY